ncbi:MAG: hypothetical protein HY245_13605 [Rhizobiales bacterium]|nr:hypothetical protein [Hyphomicrobiales bacterium]MBI3674426.1 hypothetical protein [Hyphomicrobiales bacterium]
MTKLNMVAETVKPLVTPAPADTVKHDEVKAPVTPVVTPAASATVHQK